MMGVNNRKSHVVLRQPVFTMSFSFKPPLLKRRFLKMFYIFLLIDDIFVHYHDRE